MMTELGFEAAELKTVPDCNSAGVVVIDPNSYHREPVRPPLAPKDSVVQDADPSTGRSLCALR